MAEAPRPPAPARLATALGPPRALRVFAIADEPDLVLLEWAPTGPALAGLRPRLSAAEREVAAMVLVGLSSAEIARRRARSPRTVANQLASIFRKCRVSSRLELLAFLSGSFDAAEARSDRRR